MNGFNGSSQITAQLVAEADRLNVLPNHFGRYMMVAEHLIFDFTRLLVPTYKGAYWKFYELSNGGFYMAPDIQPMEVHTENGFSGRMSPDAIGITACLYTYSHASFQFSSDPNETFAKHYHWLRDFASDHAEWAAIADAID